MTENELSGELIGIFIRVHNILGPGLLESVYEAAICYELEKMGIPYRRQQEIPVIYEDIKLEIGFRADIVVDRKVIIELKSVENLNPVFPKTLRTYLKLTGIKLGLLVNFNVELIREGLTRVVNNL